MLTINKTLLILVTAFALSGPAMLFAQSNGGSNNGARGNNEGGNANGDGGSFEDEGNFNGDYSDPEGDPFTVGPTKRKPIKSTTVVSALESATKYCTPLEPSEYVIDCLSERMSEISKQLEGQEGYEDVQAILESTAKKLNQIARQNRSTTLPPAKITTTGRVPVTSTRRLIPVDTAKMDVAVSQALVVIEEAETLLLRSAEDSTDRSIQFQQIAAAVGSNKVLLRSI